jgi:type VI secretion system FHA domain protein
MVLDAIAAAAGLPEGSLSRGNPLETATEIGRALHAMSEELSTLLQARAVARRSVRSGQVTMIGREDNNPLKFMPTPDQALSAMFGPPRPGFQRGGEAIRAAFADIKRHQYATHAAIQPALARLLEDLAPETIEARVKSSGLLQNRRAKAWDVFVERWDAKAQSHENGMLDVFLAYFAEAYDQQNRQG